MEFGGENSLHALIEERRERRLGMFPAAQILHVALSVARALQYLHTEQRLLHGDVKSPNVVVRGDFQDVKICDVGVSLPLDHNMQGGDSTGDSQNSQRIPKIPCKFPEIPDQFPEFSTNSQNSQQIPGIPDEFPTNSQKFLTNSQPVIPFPIPFPLQWP
ncbi:hypothetical protein DUI87_28919 [Hirundo rustica rustica]|uniref:Protein kinase domain-containing protein n=1 Tax=Hirundo rustica rustica TaxID=333673 RepID=A0A3M0J166_HIRRU|nr:hypothetical protein DUI87_28919 [Hirundo rustica rustica]